MPWLTKFLLAPKALRQLGVRPLLLYGRYQFKLRSGILRLRTQPRSKPRGGEFALRAVIKPAEPVNIINLLGDKQSQLLSQANEILNGQVRLFGTDPRPLDFTTPTPLKHWTAYTSSLPEGEDIKPIWEVGRFGWATVLARAYWVSEEEKYTEGFWKLTEQFFEINPINMGPQWSSAQEVALRLIALAFCYSLLDKAMASTPARKKMLAGFLAEHAERILPTLDYAQAQNNNHLLSEAVGLYTAAVALPQHPRASVWQTIGRPLFIEGIHNQIHEDGAYAQHSANYHRLMLQLGTWFVMMGNLQNEPLPIGTRKRLSGSVDWLRNLLDESTGAVANLGANDGAYIVPISTLPFDDFRPALQAAAVIFQKEKCFSPGPWDEMLLWLGLNQEAVGKRKKPSQPLRIEGKESWATLRTAQFKERPSHADQLHVDLWWRGHNVARDAGSYLYTAAAPWENALASTRVHNLVMVENREQMSRAGRFLWLDWAQARVIATEAGESGRLEAATAEHDGYLRLGVRHRREIRFFKPEHWVIADYLLPTGKAKIVNARVHWLLPDWDWQIENDELHLQSPDGPVELLIEISAGDQSQLSLVRAGKVVHGKTGLEPILGWQSPTYGIKLPALSFCIDVKGTLPITMKSIFSFPEHD